MRCLDYRLVCLQINRRPCLSVLGPLGCAEDAQAEPCSTGQLDDFADDFVGCMQSEVGVAGPSGKWEAKEVEQLGRRYRFRISVTVSWLADSRTAWSPWREVMEPSRRTVEVEGREEGEKACRWEGRIRGVARDIMCCLEGSLIFQSEVRQNE